MKKGYLNSLFLGAALGLSFVTVSPLIQAAQAPKSPLAELGKSPLAEIIKSPLEINTSPVPGLIKEKAKGKEKEKLSYRLVYADNSPLKTIPLSNAQIKVRVYTNGCPKGDKELKTNEEAEFDFEKMPKNHRPYIGMNLVKIQDDSNNKQACQGYFVKAKNELLVTCEKKG